MALLGVGAAPLSLFRAVGPNVTDVLQDILSCDVRLLKPGEGTLACLLNSRGAVVSFFHLLRRDNDFVFFLPPDPQYRFDPTMRRYFSLTECFWGPLEDAVTVFFHGPEAPAVLEFPLWDVSDRLLGTAGRVGFWNPSEGGAEGLVHRFKGAQWMTAEEFETLRVEGGVPILGKDVGEDVSPFEMGLDPYCDTEKGCYVGQEIVARWRKSGRSPRKLAGVRLPVGVGVNTRVFWHGEETSLITSVAPSPGVGGALGMVFLRPEVLTSADPLSVRLHDGEFVVDRVPLPLGTSAL